MSCVSRYRSQPEFFIDRSLGRHDVPALLREEGWCVRTHFEVFGDRDEEVQDEEWLEYCARERLFVLSKDKRLRFRPGELKAIQRHGLQAFVLTTGTLKALQQANRFIAHRAAIEGATSCLGPLVYAVHVDRIKQVFPPAPARELTV